MRCESPKPFFVEMLSRDKRPITQSTARQPYAQAVSPERANPFRRKPLYSASQDAEHNQPSSSILDNYPDLAIPTDAPNFQQADFQMPDWDNSFPGSEDWFHGWHDSTAFAGEAPMGNGNGMDLGGRTTIPL